MSETKRGLSPSEVVDGGRTKEEERERRRKEGGGEVAGLNTWEAVRKGYSAKGLISG